MIELKNTLEISDARILEREQRFLASYSPQGEDLLLSTKEMADVRLQDSIRATQDIRTDFLLEEVYTPEELEARAQVRAIEYRETVRLAMTFCRTLPLHKDVDTLREVLSMCRSIAQGRTTELTTKIPQVVGGNTSPNLWIVPTTSTGALDIAAMKNTAMTVASQYLTFGEYTLPAPLYTESYTIVHLVNGECDYGLFLDVDPMAVSMDSAIRKVLAERDPACVETRVREGVVRIAKSAQSSFAHTVQKELLEFHEGWCSTAQFHVRPDLEDLHVAVDPTSADIIARAYGVTRNEVNGMALHITRYPLVNKNGRLSVILHVIDGPDTMQRHYATNENTLKCMLGDCDGDAPALHAAFVAINNTILDLLNKGNK